MKLSIPLFLAFAGLAAGEGLAPGCSLVPGWTQDGPSRTFVADNLFEYMDGNAEGYLLYQFARMNGVNCKNAAGTVVVFDVSEMSDPELAYGIFMANRDANAPVEKLGMAGQVTPRKAMLAKDKYYVEAGSNSPDAAALRALVTAMAAKIEGRTELPDAVQWFPKKGLVAGSVRLVPESVLGMRVLKRGYVGQYDIGKAFILREKSPQSAAQVMEKLRDRIGETQPAKLGEEALQANDKYLGSICIFRKGIWIAGVANAKQAQDAGALAAEIERNIR
ncbi:MAG: hypothetical protein NTY38_27375 [Acidobacteria bacterium]|nr:hypothetical protein [Acidobacteriota bacterium]